MANIRVLVFGASGTGKTSLCNTLTGQSKLAESGAFSVTTSTHQYDPINSGSHSITLIDTPGLNEYSQGKVPRERAILQLVDLIKTSEQGFSLLIQVMRFSDRITVDHAADHKFFVQKMAQGEIPVLLVVTGCENEIPMSSWLEKSRSAFSRFRYAKILATCFAQAGDRRSRLVKLRNESKTALTKAIIAEALAEPRRLYGKGTRNSFDQLLTKLWNHFVEVTKLGDEFRREINESAYEFLLRLGVPQKVAAAAVEHIPDLTKEVGKKLPIPYGGNIGAWVGRLAVSPIKDWLEKNRSK
jgi:GTPase SAR1 family protein